MVSSNYSEQELKDMHLESTKRIAKEIKSISHLHWEEGMIETDDRSDGVFIFKEDYEELIEKLEGTKTPEEQPEEGSD